MTMKFSTGMRNAMNGPLGLSGAIQRGIIKVFSGAQPASADAAETGTLLGTMSLAHAAVTRETRASATLTVTGGSGTLTAITVGTLPIVDAPGDVVWATDTTVTAALIAAAINRAGYAEATSAAAVVTVKPRPGMGAAWNGLALASTGIVCTGSNFASGVAPVAGLVLEVSTTAGMVQKPAAADWSMVGVADGNAGWFRFYPSNTSDSGALLSAAPWYPRIDGTCGVGSGDLQMSSLVVETGLPVSVDRFRLTMPAS